MTRLLFAVGTVAAAAAGALLALAVRDLRRPWSWPVDDMAGVQESDPWLEHPQVVVLRRFMSTQNSDLPTGGIH